MLLHKDAIDISFNGEQELRLEKRLIRRIAEVRHCRYCRSLMRSLRGECREFGHWRTVTLKICRSCGWYALHDNFLDDGMWSFKTAVLEERSISDESLPLNVVKAELLRNWSSRTELTARQAEEVIVSVLKAHLNCDVRYVTNTYAPDRGIDFVLVESDRTSIALQIKRRIIKNVEPVTEVRAFLGAMVVNGFTKGIYVTTANRFSRNVLEEFSNSIWLAQQGLSVSLLEAPSLFEILRLQQVAASNLPQLAKSMVNDRYDLTRYCDVESGERFEILLDLLDALFLSRNK